MPLQIIRQDITKIECDAIVNPSNRYLEPGGGADLAIHEAAGPELFDYCQILEGYITKSGWKFLIEYYGYERLLEIDKRSGWLSERTECNLGEYIKWIQYEIESYPNEK